MVRFLNSVVEADGCWIWNRTAGGTKSRYGYFRPGTKQTDKRTLAHRWIYSQTRGAIPEGWEVDHLCKQALCVNPNHLEAVTPEENQRRRRLAVCQKGLHDLTDPANRRGPDHRGRERGCKPCRAQWERDRWRARK
jgi:predicted SprT family Zn-dependent metalloprotease